MMSKLKITLRDYYYILGIEPNASEQEIKSAYRKLSHKFHPDKNNGEKYFEGHFKAIQEAYETLSNPDQRRSYDFRLASYKSRGINEELLKNKEKEFKKRFEEDLAKREEEHRIKNEENKKREEKLKQSFKEREEQIRKEFEEKTKEEAKSKPPIPLNLPIDKKRILCIICISVCVILGLIFVIYKVNVKNPEHKSTSDSKSTAKDSIVSVDIGVGISLKEIIELYFNPIKLIDQSSGFYKNKIKIYHYKYLKNIEVTFNKQDYKLVLFETTYADIDPHGNFEISKCYTCPGWLTIIRMKYEKGNWIVDEFEPFPACCGGDFGSASIPEIKIFNDEYAILYSQETTGNQGTFNSWLDVCNFVDLNKCKRLYFAGGEVKKPDILSNEFNFVLDRNSPVISYIKSQSTETKTISLMDLFQYVPTSNNNISGEMKYSIAQKYLITDHSVGNINLGDPMPTMGQNDEYTVKKEARSRYTEEGNVIDTLLIFYYNARECFYLKRKYDYANENYVDIVGEITVVSDDFRTKNNIGVNSTVEEFIAIYPNYEMWYSYISDRFVMQSKESQTQYLLNNDDYLSSRYLESDIEIVKKSEFREDSKIIQIRLY